MGADWKECNTELIMANTQDTLLTYSVRWLDHDIEKFKSRSVMRCGGEVKAYSMINMSESKFRLCPGRHIVIWHKRDHVGPYSYYKFIVTNDMTQIVLTPEKMEILKI
jgi:hypothetical protein